MWNSIRKFSIITKLTVILFLSLCVMYCVQLFSGTSGNVREDRTGLDALEENETGLDTSEEKGEYFSAVSGEAREEFVAASEEGAEKSVQKDVWKETMEEPSISVLITAQDGSYCHKKLDIRGTDDLTIESAAGRELIAGHKTLNLKKYFKEKSISSCSIALAAASQKRRTASEREEYLSYSSGIQILSLQKSGLSPVYPGVLQVALTDDGKGFYIVNDVSLEQYLPRVVASEMPERFGLEALKSQAVCARSYAAAKLSVEKTGKDMSDETELSWNLTDTTADQVYNASPLDELTIQACRDTAGEILWDETEEQPVIPHYYSTSWGYGADEAVFSKGYLHTAVLPGRQLSEKQIAINQDFIDHYLDNMNHNTEYDSPWFRWMVWIPLNRIFQKKTTEITVEKRGTGGYVTELVVGYEDGSQERITGASRIRQTLETGDNVYYLQDGTSRTGMKLLPSAFFYMDAIVTEGKQQFVVLHGGGYGHGYGMSQYGAAALAKNGADYKEILTYYFGGIKTTVKQQYGKSE